MFGLYTPPSQLVTQYISIEVKLYCVAWAPDLECCRGQGQRAEGGDVAVFDSAGETEVVVQPAAAFIGARAV